MNILYYTYNKIHSTKGGTERTTITIAEKLTINYGCHCYSIYENPANTPMESCFIKEFLWPKQKKEYDNIIFLRNIITTWDINVIIIQGAFIHVKKFREAASKIDCKIIFAHHFAPKWETNFFSFGRIFHRKTTSYKDYIKKIRDLMFFPLMYHNYIIFLSTMYQEAYERADYVVLLSNQFIKPYKEFGRFIDETKFRIIPNALSFKEFIPDNEFDKKKNIVLIVARLDETSKKISDALYIWEIVKQHPQSRNWILKIVGEGNDLKSYQNLVSQRAIPDVVFCGRQNPIPYYKEASLFMMTSKSESWGLTLTEAQQMGVVPIAFDTYPTIYDIITDLSNGFIIPAGNIKDYAAKLIELMSNTSYRNHIAHNGRESCKQFSSDIIVQYWWNIITT